MSAIRARSPESVAAAHHSSQAASYPDFLESQNNLNN
jgi:hypothetical protein